MPNQPRDFRGTCGLTHIVTPAELTTQFHPDTPDEVIHEAAREGSGVLRDWTETVPRAWHVTVMDETDLTRHVTVTTPTLRDSIESAHLAIDADRCLPCPNATDCPLRKLVDAVEAVDGK